MQPRPDELSNAAGPPPFQAMALDIRGVLRGGFSSALDIPRSKLQGRDRRLIRTAKARIAEIVRFARSPNKQGFLDEIQSV